MPKLVRAPSHHRYSNQMPMPVPLPNSQTMAFYSTRGASSGQMQPTTDYYGNPMTSSSSQIPSMTTMSYDPYAVAPLSIPPPHTTASHHHATSYLTSDPHPRASLPTQHRASSGAWNANDDQTLLGARASGQNWAQIQQNYFAGKTPNACRKRHERLMERKGADDWDSRKLEKMAKEYMSLRKEIWAPLAQRTGEKWNVVEQKCMSNGLKNLQGAARAAARRERLEAGQPLTGYDDDSGISGIDGLTPIDDLGAEGGYSMAESPGRSTSSGNGSSTASQQGYSTAPTNYTGYGQQQQYSNYPHHAYNSSVSSTGTAGYHQGGQGSHSQSASPYIDPNHSRMPSVDMGIDAIINRPGHQGGVQQ